ncbi:MAG: glycoside hydrolase family 3 N-terminal domain-containing protein [Gammaproteobacteria bacterium]
MTNVTELQRNCAADQTRRNLLKIPLIAAVPYIANAKESVDPAAIASMLLMGFLGSSTKSASARALAHDLSTRRVGGVCFLGHNTKNREDIENLSAMFNEAGNNISALIAIDQEGGAVQRLGKRSGYSSFPRARTVATRHSSNEARDIYKELATGLKDAGFNLNLAPVVDLGVQPANPVVYRWGRTFGETPEIVTDFAAAFIEAHRAVGIATAVKHFPGHGSTLIDSHAQAVDLTNTWNEKELGPYKLLAANGLIDIVMSGHLSHQAITEGLPATLSPKAVALIRNDLKFAGVVMTDDLDMKAIRTGFSLIDAVIRAIAAGYDLILLSNSLKPDPALPVRVIGAVETAVKEGRLSANSIHESAERLHKLKQQRGFA